MAQSQPRGLSGAKGLRRLANADVCSMLPRLSPIVGHNSCNIRCENSGLVRYHRFATVSGTMMGNVHGAATMVHGWIPVR
jgi:hypothetical protein